MHYRRTVIQEGTYFFTVNLAARNNTLLTDEIDMLRKVINNLKQERSFQFNAMVVLPDHLHALLNIATQ